MKKSIYFFYLLGLVLAFHNTKAQIPNVVISPQVQCFNGNNSSNAYVSPLVPGATSYTWVVTSPSACAASVVTYSNGIGAMISYPCCGIYTISCLAFNGTTFVSTITQTSAVNCGGASVTVNASPSSTICSGNPLNLIASGAINYTWSNGYTGPILVVSPSVSTCYSVVGTNLNGCSGSAVKCVTVVPAPVLSIVGNGPICAGTGATLTAGGASSYTWNTVQGTFTGSTIVLTPSATSCYSLTGSNGGCMGFTGGCVTVTPGSNPVINSNNFNICAGQSAVLYASGATSYTWYPGGSTSPSISVSPSVTTCYTLAAYGCSSVNYAVRCVTVTPGGGNPVISSNNFNICAGQTAVLYASGASSYTWYPGGSSSPSIVVSPSVTSCYTLAGSGCSSNNYAVGCVTVGTSPVLSISGNTSVCAGHGATLTASGASSYTWMTSQGTFTGSTIVLTPSTSTCYSLVGANGSCMGYSGGCVSVSTGSNITITGNSTVCAGSSVILHASGSSSYTWMPGSLIGDSIIVTPTGSTCYTAFGAVGSSCNNYAVKCITVQFSSSVGIQSGQTTICSGTFATLSAYGAANYTWQPGNSHNATINISPLSTTCYTVTGSGCAGSSSAIQCITVVPGPTVTATNATVCAGNSATLVASGANTYAWFGPNSFYSTGPVIVVSPNATSCYTVYGYNSMGCQSSALSCVNVQGGNLAVNGNTFICAGSTTTLTASGAQSYTWIPGGMVGASIAVSPTATTCYTVIGSNQSGCGGTQVICVYVNPRPTIITGSGFFCAGQSNSLTATGAYTYTWLPYNLNGASIVITPSISTCYTVIGTSTSGCTNSAVGCFSVFSSPSLTISGTNSYCSGAPTTLSVSGGQTYTWLPSNTTGATLSVAPLVSTCYTVISYSGCMGTAVKCLSVQAGPTVTIGGSNSLCAGATTTLFANGASTYTWLPGNLTGAVVAISPTASTCYTVVGTNSNGCIGLGYQCLQIIPRPNISTSSNFFCSGSAGLLQAQGANTYTWLPFGLTGSSISITPSVSTCYTVIGSNSSGCSNSAVSCFSVLPAPVITVIGNGSICAGSSTTLSAAGAASYTWLPTNTTGANLVVSPTANSCYTVIGSNGGGCTSRVVKCITVQTGAQLNVSGANIICAGTSANLLASGANTFTWNTGSNSPFITITPSISTCYTVSGTTAGGCIGSAVKCVSVQSSPIVNISGPGSICYGSNAVLAASGASSYSWNTGSTASVISVAPSTSTVYTVIGNNGNCSGVKSITVVVNPRPTIYIHRTDTIIHNDSIICAGNAVHLLATGAVTYTWNNGASTPSIVVSPSTTTTYTVSGTSANGCTNSNLITIHVSACTGLSKNTENLEVGFYPNPTSGNLTLQGNGLNKIGYTLYDVIGRELLKGEFTATKNLDLSDYTNGTYIIRFEAGSATSYKKLVIEK